MPTKIFVSFALEPKLRAEIEKALEGHDATVSFLPEKLDKAEREAFVLREVSQAEVVLTGMLSPEQFAAAKNLKWIQVPYAGVNNLLKVDGIVDSPVILTNGAGVMAPGLADQIMGYIISFSRHLYEQFKFQQRKEWGRLGGPKHPMRELAGQTLGIIGYGKIGSELAKRAKGFGMRVIATKHRIEGDYPELDVVLPDNELNRLLAESDFVVVCAPLTPETEGMIGRAQFEQMKPGAYFINIARGQLVKEDEMIEILREKRIAGAALDVFEKEPLPADSPIWDLDNVIITPHSSGNFEGFMVRAVALFAGNLRRYLSGQPLVNVVDKRRGY